MSHHKGGFEPETNGFQFYAIANLDKTSLATHMQREKIPRSTVGPYPSDPVHAVGPLVI